MVKVSLVIDFEIPEGLAEIYLESQSCPYVGDKEGPRDLQGANADLERYVNTNQYGNRPILGIMKIYHYGILVGFSFPRAIMEKEYKVFKLNGDKPFYRIGTIYISKAFRGLGIVKETIRQFKEIYPNMLWTCNSLNTASEATALSGGLEFSHHIYVRPERKWEFHPVEDQVRIDNVYKTEVDQNA